MALDKTAKRVLVGVVGMFAACAAFVTDSVSDSNQKAEAKRDAAAAAASRLDSIADEREIQIANHREAYARLHNNMGGQFARLQDRFPGEAQRDSAARALAGEKMNHLSETGASIYVDARYNDVVFKDPVTGVVLQKYDY